MIWKGGSEYSDSIVYSSSLGDDTVDEGVDEALICDITSCRENNDIGIDDGDFFSRLLKLACIDVCDSNALASACCESLCNGSSDSCAGRQSSHTRKDALAGSNSPDPAAPVTSATPGNSLPFPKVTEEIDMLLGVPRVSEKLFIPMHQSQGRDDM